MTTRLTTPPNAKVPRDCRRPQEKQRDVPEYLSPGTRPVKRRERHVVGVKALHQLGPTNAQVEIGSARR